MPQSKPVRGFAPVNGQRMHYEIHGAGEPVLLLHGEFGSVAEFETAAKLLCRDRQVILVDMQGHGGTADIDRPLCFELLADDIAAVIRHLGFDNADLVGFSLGGCVALQAAIRNPRAIGKLVVASAPYSSDGWLPVARAEIDGIDGRSMLGSPVHASYESAAPRPGDWLNLAAKIRTLLTFPFDWAGELARIEAPTLVVSNEHDRVACEHAASLARAVANQRESLLVTLPGEAHGEMLATPAFADAIRQFLDRPETTIQ